jgi:hypothetical protein
MGREAGHSPPLMSRLRKRGSIPGLPLYALMPVNRDRFTLSFTFIKMIKNKIITVTIVIAYVICYHLYEG